MIILALQFILVALSFFIFGANLCNYIKQKEIERHKERISDFESEIKYQKEESMKTLPNGNFCPGDDLAQEIFGSMDYLEKISISKPIKPENEVNVFLRIGDGLKTTAYILKLIENTPITPPLLKSIYTKEFICPKCPYLHDEEQCKQCILNLW